MLPEKCYGLFGVLVGLVFVKVDHPFGQLDTLRLTFSTFDSLWVGDLSVGVSPLSRAKCGVAMRIGTRNAVLSGDVIGQDGRGGE